MYLSKSGSASILAIIIVLIVSITGISVGAKFLIEDSGNTDKTPSEPTAQVSQTHEGENSVSSNDPENTTDNLLKNNENSEQINTTNDSKDKVISGDSGNKTTTKKPNSNVPVAAPVVPTQPVAQSAPSSKVENASDTKDLAQIDPESAADKVYDAEVSVEETDTSEITTNEYQYIAYSDFESHIDSVWANFKTNEKVKVEAKYMNEYLNYLCLPLKESFYEINCNGYEVTYGYDDTGTYAYMNITWSYYINASQYSSCKTKAKSICSGLSGSTADKIKAVHDYIAKSNTYAINVDGAYNCLINNRSDCDGYTAAFQICMDILGIPCKAFTTSDHIFNCVQVNGNWYIVDVTYDDQSEKLGFIYNKYFLIGYQEYSNYDILTSFISSSDYSYSKKITVTDDDKFRAFLQLDDSVTYELSDDGNIYLSNGYYYTLT